MASMAELRAECARLGIQPGRSVAECERRIRVRNGAEPAAPDDYVTPPEAIKAPRRMSRLARALCGSTALRGTFAAGHPCIYMGAPLTVDIARLVGFEAGIVARSWAPEPCARKWA